MKFLNYFFSVKKPFPNQDNLPKHIAVIMDGNGRWANKRFLPRSAGHAKGVDAAKLLIDLAQKYSISTLTLFAFSTENWGRPKNEVDSLFSLFNKSIKDEKNKIKLNDIRIKFIGDKATLPISLQKKIHAIESKCKGNKGMRLNIAISYGGRSEIVRAVKKFIETPSKNLLINEASLSKHLDTYGMPDVDLLIRTGGEKRISNFLLWQLAYSELHFTDTLWPDFNERSFMNALLFYQSRNRRYGSLVGANNA